MLATGVGHDSWIPVNTADPDLEASSSHGSSNPMNRPSAPGFPNIGGFNNFRSDGEDEGSGQGAKKESTPFPGSGHKLTTNSNSSTSSSFFSSSSSSASQSAGTGAIPSKEAIAQRRLAALGAMNNNATATASSNSSQDNPSLQKLLVSFDQTFSHLLIYLMDGMCK
jgi:hypothetical protein